MGAEWENPISKRKKKKRERKKRNFKTAPAR
jgi:ribosomal protein S21